MAIEAVRAFFTERSMADRIQEFAVSSATVALAAEAVGVEGARIAKTLSFEGESGGFLLVTAGDAKIDNAKFRHAFHRKAKMLTPEAVLALTGHAVGGVCPFAIDEAVPVYLDISLQRFETVFPACGSSNSAIELTPDSLFSLAGARGWVDVCKGWEQPA